MGQSAEELRRDIEDTRNHMGTTLDAIGDRVSPSRIVDRRRNRMRATYWAARDAVMGTARDTGQSVSARTSGAGASIGDKASGAADALYFASTRYGGDDFEESARVEAALIRARAAGNASAPCARHATANDGRPSAIRSAAASAAS